MTKVQITTPVLPNETMQKVLANRIKAVTKDEETITTFQKATVMTQSGVVFDLNVEEFGDKPTPYLSNNIYIDLLSFLFGNIQ